MFRFYFGKGLFLGGGSHFVPAVHFHPVKKHNFMKLSYYIFNVQILSRDDHICLMIMRVQCTR